MIKGDPDVTRAYLLADRWAREVVESEGVPANVPGHFGMAGENQTEVQSLAETSEDFQEAAQWLIDRGQADLIEDEKGDVLILKEDA